jgi:thiol-disulfide isomerase/thioredoxin
MKYILALLFISLALGCRKIKVLSYEEGLANCTQLQMEKKKEKTFSFVGSECMLGAQIPEFEAMSIGGKKINNSLLKGKLSIINFWFITCPPCVAEIPGLNLILDKYGTHKINYLAIGKDNRKDIDEFLQEHPWKYDIIANGGQIIEDTFSIRWGFPTTFLLNKNAEIILAFSGGKSDSTAIEEIQNKLIPFIEKELK